LQSLERKYTDKINKEPSCQVVLKDFRSFSDQYIMFIEICRIEVDDDIDNKEKIDNMLDLVPTLVINKCKYVRHKSGSIYD